MFVGGGAKGVGGWVLTPPPCVTFRRVVVSLLGPWTVTRSSLRMLRWVAAFCRPLRPVLLLVSFPRSRSPVVGVPLDVAGQVKLWAQGVRTHISIRLVACGRPSQLQ